MIINKPVYIDEVEFEFSGQWCKLQIKWKDKTLCCAHLHEGRVFTCEFVDKAESQHCVDFEQAK